MKWAGWAGGIVFIALIIILVLLVPNPTGFQEWALRVPMSIGAAAFAAFVPGFLILQAFMEKEDKQASICGGGAIAVFLLLMYVNPIRLGAPAAQLFRNPLSPIQDRSESSPQQNVIAHNPTAIRIKTPVSGGRASFTIDSGQGGRVEVSGESPPLPDTNVILLTVTPLVGAGEIPQTALEKGVRPNAHGQWIMRVQVGSAEYPAKAGDRFTIRAYEVPKADYDRLRSEATSGRLRWPLPDEPTPTEADSCIIELID